MPLSSTWSICSIVGIANLISGSNRARLRRDEIRLLVKRHQHILFAVDAMYLRMTSSSVSRKPFGSSSGFG